MPILSHRPANRKGAKQTDFGSFAPFLRTQTEVRAAMPQALHLPRSLSTAVCFFPPISHISRPARARFPPQSMRPFRRCRRASNKPQSVPHLAHLPPRAHTRFPSQSMRPFRRYRRRARRKPQSVPRRAHLPPHTRARFPPQTIRPFRRYRRRKQQTPVCFIRRAHLPPRAHTRFPPQSIRPFRQCRRRARSKPQSVSPHLARLPPRAHTRFPPQTIAPFSPMPPPNRRRRKQQTPVCFATSPAPRAHPLPIANNCGLFADAAAQATNPGLFRQLSPAHKKHRLPRICGRAGASSLDHFTSEV